MNLRAQLTSALVGLTVFFAAGFGVYLFIAALINKLNSISGDLSKALVAGGIAIVTASITLVAGKYLEQRLRIRQEIREKKIPVYEEQMKTFFGVMFAQKFAKKANEENDPDALAKAFVAFSEKLVIWGGSDVIRAWCEFRSNNWNASTPKESFGKLEAFIKAIRKELGNDNSSLVDGDLLRLFVTDYDDHVNKIETEPSDAPKSPVSREFKS